MISALPVLLILFGSILRLIKTSQVLERFACEGVPVRFIVPVGVSELICVIIYVIPFTSVLHAILMTDLLGDPPPTTLGAGESRYPTPVLVGMGRIVCEGCPAAALIPLHKPPESSIHQRA